MKVVAISGGFDPVHIGHIDLMQRAKALGDRLVVIINNDNWLKKKKGFAFMSQDERAGILRAIKYVDDVIITSHPENPTDMSVCAELEKLHPDIFANGGDRDKNDASQKTSSLNPEQILCQKLGIELVFNLGEKVQSSSELVKRVKENKS